jgi:replication factor A1
VKNWFLTLLSHSTYRGHYAEIDQLPRFINGRGSVDVLGVVTSVGELGSVRRKSDQTEIQRRNITLVDETMKTVELTLWNALAVEQGEQLATMVRG